MIQPTVVMCWYTEKNAALRINVCIGMVMVDLQWHFRSSILSLCSSMENLPCSSSTKASSLRNLSPAMADVHRIITRKATRVV